MQEIIKKIGEANCEIRYLTKCIDSVKLKMYQHRRMGLTMKSSKPKSTRPGALDFSWCFNWQRRNADCQPVFACQEGCKKLHIVDVWTVELRRTCQHTGTWWNNAWTQAQHISANMIRCAVTLAWSMLACSKDEVYTAWCGPCLSIALIPAWQEKGAMTVNEALRITKIT